MQRGDREGKRGAMADLGLRSVLPSGLRIPREGGFWNSFEARLVISISEQFAPFEKFNAAAWEDA